MVEFFFFRREGVKIFVEVGTGWFCGAMLKFIHCS